MLLVGLAVGLLVSIFQAVTPIQEQRLSFIPKIVGLARADRRARAVDARPAGHLRPEPLHVDPAADRLTLTLSHLIAALGGGQPVTGFFLVLARITPLFVVAPLFSSTMIPIARQGGGRGRALRSA